MAKHTYTLDSYFTKRNKITNTGTSTQSETQSPAVPLTEENEAPSSEQQNMGTEIQGQHLSLRKGIHFTVSQIV